jgi:hypothetical protein
MIRTKRKLAALFFAAVLAPGLAACDGGTTTDTEIEEDGADPAPGTVETERPEEG